MDTVEQPLALKTRTPNGSAVVSLLTAWLTDKAFSSCSSLLSSLTGNKKKSGLSGKLRQGLANRQEAYISPANDRNCSRP